MSAVPSGECNYCAKTDYKNEVILWFSIYHKCICVLCTSTVCNLHPYYSGCQLPFRCSAECGTHINRRSHAGFIIFCHRATRETISSACCGVDAWRTVSCVEIDGLDYDLHPFNLALCLHFRHLSRDHFC